MEQEKQGTEVAIEDITYRFDEMIDSIDQSLKNVEDIINQQNRLVEIVKNTTLDLTEKEKEKFDSFCEECNSQIAELENQKSILNYKKSLCQKIVEKAKSDNEFSEFLSITAEAIGLFKNR